MRVPGGVITCGRAALPTIREAFLRSTPIHRLFIKSHGVRTLDGGRHCIVPSFVTGCRSARGGMTLPDAGPCEQCGAV